MGHLVRFAMLVAMALGLFLAFRSMPETVLSVGGSLVGGVMRGAGASTVEWANRPVLDVGSSRCNDCHQGEHALWAESKHAAVSCADCHGPAKAHLETGASLVVDTSRRLCELCHGGLPARPSDFPQVNPEEHGGQSECIACHNPHNPSISRLIPHTLQGRSVCVACHMTGVQEPLKIPADHANRNNGTCTTCHRTK